MHARTHRTKTVWLRPHSDGRSYNKYLMVVSPVPSCPNWLLPNAYTSPFSISTTTTHHTHVVLGVLKLNFLRAVCEAGDVTRNKQRTTKTKRTTLESTGYSALPSPPRLMCHCGMQSQLGEHTDTRMLMTIIPSPLAKWRGKGNKCWILTTVSQTVGQRQTDRQTDEQASRQMNGVFHLTNARIKVTLHRTLQGHFT